MNPEQKNKLFIATFLGDGNENLCRLIDELNLLADKDFKVVPMEKIHITWKFIGYVKTSENEKILNIAKSHSHIIKDNNLNFDKLEIWPSKRNPRLITITSRKHDKKFLDYFNNLEENLYKRLKIAKDKEKFIPHITLARVKNNVNLDRLNLCFKPFELKINDTNVVQSINNSDGVLYKIL